MATTVTTHVNQETTFTPTLFLACELGVNKWKLGCTAGAAQRPRERQIPAGDCHAVLEERRRAKSRFGLPEAARVVSCYEAGREGFWLHRFFVSQGVENVVVDSASLEVNRRFPPGEDGSPGGAQAAHHAAAACSGGKEGVECGTGAQRG